MWKKRNTLQTSPDAVSSTDRLYESIDMFHPVESSSIGTKGTKGEGWSIFARLHWMFRATYGIPHFVVNIDGPAWLPQRPLSHVSKGKLVGLERPTLTKSSPSSSYFIRGFITNDVLCAIPPDKMDLTRLMGASPSAIDDKLFRERQSLTVLNLIH